MTVSANTILQLANRFKVNVLRGWLCRDRVSTLVATSLAIGVILAAHSSAQQCPNLPQEGNLTTIDGFLQSAGTCTVPPPPPPPGEQQGPNVASDNWISAAGGYVKAWSVLNLHTKAETSGMCLIGVPPLPCTYSNQNDYRTVNHVIIQERPATWLAQLLTCGPSLPNS